MKNSYVEVSGKYIKTLDSLLNQNTGMSLLKDHIDRLLRNIETDSLEDYRFIAIVDLDGTLRDCCSHRIPLLPDSDMVEFYKDEPNLAYEDFHLACSGDTPIWDTINKVKQLREEGCFIILLTSCTSLDKTICETRKQLQSWELYYDTMIMRHPDNHEEPAQMKLNFISSLVTNDSDKKHFLFIDDNSENVKVIEEFGIDCILVK